MTKKPPEPTPTPAGPMQPDQLAGLVEVLALLVGRLQGMQGGELRKHVVDLKDQVQELVHTVEEREATEVAREQAAVEVEKLVDAVVGTGTALGRTLETQREPIVDAFRGADLAKAAEGLKLLADWMMHPTDEGRARVEELVLQLQRSMGTLVGYDPARDEAARKEELRLGVKASLDKIFKPKPKA